VLRFRAPHLISEGQVSGRQVLEAVFSRRAGVPTHGPPEPSRARAVAASPRGFRLRGFTLRGFNSAPWLTQVQTPRCSLSKSPGT